MHKTINDHRLAEKRRENRTIFRKRSYHIHMNELDELPELLLLLGVPRGDGEANQMVRKDDPYREYRRNAVKKFLGEIRNYAAANGGPKTPCDVSPTTLKSRDIEGKQERKSPCDTSLSPQKGCNSGSSEPMVRSDKSNKGSNGDTSTKADTDQNTALSSSAQGSGGNPEQYTLWDSEEIGKICPEQGHVFPETNKHQDSSKIQSCDVSHNSNKEDNSNV